MKVFIDQNGMFLQLCQIFKCEFNVISGELTYTSNMWKIDALIITIKLFCAKYYWLSLKFFQNMVTKTILRNFLTVII